MAALVFSALSCTSCIAACSAIVAADCMRCSFSSRWVDRTISWMMLDRQSSMMPVACNYNQSWALPPVCQTYHVREARSRSLSLSAPTCFILRHGDFSIVQAIPGSLHNTSGSGNCAILPQEEAQGHGLPDCLLSWGTKEIIGTVMSVNRQGRGTEVVCIEQWLIVRSAQRRAEIEEVVSRLLSEHRRNTIRNRWSVS